MSGDNCDDPDRPCRRPLPEGFEPLRAEAAADGWGHLDRLAADWPDGHAYDALFAAYVEAELAGVGAVTPEPEDPHARRMRRCYVAERFRGQGVGRTLASAMMQQGLALAPSLTVNASRPGSRAFWQAMGFAEDARNGWSHRYAP